jgi:hypothetical protein
MSSKKFKKTSLSLEEETKLMEDKLNALRFVSLMLTLFDIM